ncbi:MAG: hypothetical protein HUJ65_03025, partial [Oscillospiraceae bacterium]|nr:hypothetical protein [Oscillospiraceae bacterium]
MKKLSLLASLSEKDEILRQLMLLGCVEINEPQKITDDEELRSLLRPESSDLNELRSKKASIDGALKLINRYVPQKTPLFAALPEVTEEELLSEEKLGRCLELAREIEECDGRLRDYKMEESRLRADISSLSCWKGLGIDLNFSGTRTTLAQIGTLPTAVSIDEVNAAFGEECAAEVMEIANEGVQSYVLALIHRSDSEKAAAVLHSFGFALSVLHERGGSAEENIAEAERGLEETETKSAAEMARITEIAGSRDELKLVSDMLSTKVTRAEASEKLMTTGESFVMTGWVPEASEKDVMALLDRFCAAYEFEKPTQEDTPDVPVKLVNNRLTRPLMMVTEMYSLPSYDGLDPNPLIFPWFSIFFGIMFADMGYGLIFLIVGILGSIKLKRAKGTLGYILGLLKLCGITTIIFGFLMGSFFGDSLTVFSRIIGIEEIKLWSITNPVEDPMTVLIAALAIGGLHILTGMAIKAYMLIRDGHPLDALFDVGSWWLLFAGLALGALGKGWYVCIAGALALILTQGRDKPTIIGKLIGGLASLYDITSYFGDILSYIRLMALMLAGSVIASVVNILGGLKGSIVMFILVFIVGHVFNNYLLLSNK